MLPNLGGWVDGFEIVSFIALFLLMVSIGTELVVDDFRRIARFPALIAVASAAQFVLLPPLAWALSLALDLGDDVLVGMLILGACPAGGFSNLYTYAGRGHLALSVSLTAVTCTAAVLAMPPLLEWSFRAVADRAQIIPIPAGQMFGELSMRVLAPIAVGMALRHFRPGWVERHAKTLGRGTLILMIAIIPAVVIDQGASVLSSARNGVLPALLFTAAAMAIGWGVGRLLGRDEADPFTVMIEFGARNVAVAVIICWSVLQRPELLSYCFAYMFVQVPLAVIAIGVRRARNRDIPGNASAT
jgi:BASS family bile acid:Na+ symporter